MLGNQISDGGVASLRVGMGGGQRMERGYDHYPDFPRPTSLPPLPRGQVELPLPASNADAYALEFDKKLRVAKGLIRSCYDRALRAAPALAGEVTLEISLGADGKVLSVATPASTVGNEVPACLRAQLPRLRFPPPTGGAYKRTVTMKLRPESRDAGAPAP
jgi:hypothetical protein